MSGPNLTHTLSVVIPCYNEEATLAQCLEAVLAIASDRLKLDIIVVDDASRDGSVQIAQRMADAHPEIRLLRHSANGGKGAALQTGFAAARGDYVVVQDADLEYNPQDLLKMVAHLAQEQADVVLGSRFSGNEVRNMPYNRMRIGNQVLTWISNRFTGLAITDMETCYKMFRREIIQSIPLCEKRFGIEPEMMAKIARFRKDGKPLRIAEEAVRYHGRTFEEGKKIRLRDGFRAIYCITKYGFR